MRGYTNTMQNTVRYQYISLEKLALDIGIDTKLFGQWERKLVEPKLFNLLCWCEALQIYLTISHDDGEF